MELKRITSVNSFAVDFQKVIKGKQTEAYETLAQMVVNYSNSNSFLGSITRDIVNTFPKLLESRRYNIRKMGKQTEFSRVRYLLSFGCQIIFTNSPII